jgi:hypothetical protein
MLSISCDHQGAFFAWLIASVLLNFTVQGSRTWGGWQDIMPLLVIRKFQFTPDGSLKYSLHFAYGPKPTRPPAPGK